MSKNKGNKKLKFFKPFDFAWNYGFMKIAFVGEIQTF